MIDTDQLLEEAQNCRRQALAYVGGGEAPFLIRVADAFEDLARARADNKMGLRFGSTGVAQRLDRETPNR